jgi:HAD superfamily hydrolase (TIGR01509 family)
VRAIVFDLDGVLINSEPVWDEVRHGLADSAGRPWPTDATREMQGMSTAEWSRYLADTVGIPEPAETIAEQVVGAMAARYETAVPLMPGAVEAVTRLASRFTLGLASSSPPRLIDAVLDTAGLAAHFAATMSTEEVAAGKPSPAVYLEIVRRLGVPPAETAAVEDSSNGLRSAHAAGLFVVAAPNELYPPVPDALALARVRLNTLADLTPELFD